MPRFKILKKVFSSYIKLFAYRPKVFQTELKRVMFFSNVSARQFVGLSSFRAGDYKKQPYAASENTPAARPALYHCQWLHYATRLGCDDGGM